jgi:hypothetical protein
LAALAISRALNVELPSVSTARDKVVLVRRLPFELGADWRATLGTFRTERLEASNLLIFASESSPYLNERHRDPLIRKVRAFYYALMMLGGPGHESGLLFAGGVTSTGPNVLCAQDLIPAVPRPLGRPTPITVQALEVAADISEGIIAIQGRHAHNRLERGFWTWVGAIREQHLHVRLHQFVRSIDALIGTERREKAKSSSFREDRRLPTDATWRASGRSYIACVVSRNTSALGSQSSVERTRSRTCRGPARVSGGTARESRLRNRLREHIYQGSFARRALDRSLLGYE